MFYHLFRVDIEMIRWLIHDDDIRASKQHLGKCDLSTFSSRESRDDLLDFISGNQESTKHRANILLIFMLFSQLSYDAHTGIKSFKYLTIAPNSKSRMNLTCSRECWKLSENGFEKCRFPSSIFPDDSYLILFVNLNKFWEYDERIVISDDDIL